MTVLTERDPSELSDVDLVAEWRETAERLHAAADRDVDGLWDRRVDLWAEMESRTAVEPPECPECDAQSWTQEFGGPKICTECDLHLRMEHADLIAQIDEYHEHVQALDGGASA